MRSAMSAAGPAYVVKHRSYAVLAEKVAARYRALLGDDARANGARPAMLSKGRPSP
jgi:hypothetical protein